jgi:hypothetical protein
MRSLDSGLDGIPDCDAFSSPRGFGRYWDGEISVPFGGGKNSEREFYPRVVEILEVEGR